MSGVPASRPTVPPLSLPHAAKKTPSEIAIAQAPSLQLIIFIGSVAGRFTRDERKRLADRRPRGGGAVDPSPQPVAAVPPGPRVEAVWCGVHVRRPAWARAAERGRPRDRAGPPPAVPLHVVDERDDVVIDPHRPALR